MPTLSICIPTYNRAPLLAELLRGLQGLEDFDFETEVIVFDNASSDETPDVVAAASKGLANLRYYRQERNTGAIGNSVAAFAEAQGTYALYLADDDRLNLGNLQRLVHFLQDQPETVACFVSWLLTCEQTGNQIPFFPLDEVHFFNRFSALDCFNFVIQNGVFPDIGIYRTDVLHKTLFYPHHTYVGFDFLFKFLRHGNVCFHPDSYYVSVVRPDGGLNAGDQGQIGHHQAVYEMDKHRGGLETALMIALEQMASLPMDESSRMSALNAISEFMRQRLDTAARLCRNHRDFIGCHELRIRSALWQRDLLPGLFVEQCQQDLASVALQAIVERFHHNTLFQTLVLCGFKNADQLKMFVEMCPEKTPCEIRSLEALLDTDNREGWLVVVNTAVEHAQAVNSGMRPGHVICIQDVMQHYRISPFNGESVIQRAS